MYDETGCGIGCLFLFIVLFGLVGLTLSSQDESYELKQLTSAEIQTTVTEKENNAIIGQFFIGSTEKVEKEKEREKIISLQYVTQTKEGVQLRNFQREYDKDIFDKGVYFKESKDNKAKLTVQYTSILWGVIKRDMKITFYLPKDDLQKILSRI